MSDEGEESDSGERAHLSGSPSPPLSVCLPRGSPSSQRPLDFFSSASPLLGDTDPPYLASPDCLHASPENREPGDSPHFTPPKFRQRTGDTGSPFRSRQDVRIEAVYDDPFPKWRGRGAANAERFQHRGQRLQRAPELSDYGNHYTVEHIDTEFNSETRQT
ncbi:short transient receptor potential channel 7-like [Lates japonicus]